MTGKTFIWDLDGTLLDSYGVIVSSLRQTLAEIPLDEDPSEVLHQVKDGSVSAFLRQTAERAGLPYQRLKERYSAISGGRILEIPAMPHAEEVLRETAALGADHYVYTHRGRTTAAVLENLGIRHYFREVVSSLDGFPRKPSPDALRYLMDKHHLEKDRVFYVGDRGLDMECAKNAGVRGVLYSPSGAGTADYVVRDLLEILGLAGR